MVIPFLSALVIFFTFRFWITLLPLSSGDWPYLFLENIKEFSWLPEIRFLWLAPYYQIVTKFVVEYLQIPWEITEKLFWFLPFISVSLWASYKFTRSALGALIYTTNTYALMIVGGGQMGVAMAYALAPLVLLRNWLFPVQVMFDPRIALLTFVVALRKKPKQLIIPVLVTIAIHTYWWIPLIKNPSVLSVQFQDATSSAVRFLSFATFEQTISLLHPNWPENIFGKIGFMKPEFLVLAMLAFGSLLVLPKKTEEKLNILYFSFLALLGAFLAKGTNPPFGGIYLWLFENIPGFSFFRDPTKFYLYVALAFSVLIPYVLKKVNGGKIVSLLFVLFWSFTIREALLGQLTGTFRPMRHGHGPVPQQYVRLKDSLISQQESFQTLWIPEKQRFGFQSKQHPALDAKLLSGESSVSGILTWVRQEDTKSKLDNLNVRYIVIPFDNRGELFLIDRKYDETLYNETIQTLDAVPWLKKMDTFAPIMLYENTR